MLVNLPDAMTVQFGSLNNVWSENAAVQIYFKNILFSIWVPISEERKANSRNSYLRILVRIAESFYSGGSAPVSGSASTYVRSGSTSIYVSGSESTILLVCNNLEVNNTINWLYKALFMNWIFK
jgi:hypothetical protein